MHPFETLKFGTSSQEQKKSRFLCIPITLLSLTIYGSYFMMYENDKILHYGYITNFDPTPVVEQYSFRNIITKSTLNATSIKLSTFVAYQKIQNNAQEVSNLSIVKYPLEPSIYPKFPRSLSKEDTSNTSSVGKKIILFWNKFFTNEHFNIYFGSKQFAIEQCEFQNCFTTANRSRFLKEEVDAIIWHFRGEKSLPKARYPNAKYIFFLAESPSNAFGSFQHFNGVFDYTATYRTDSDIPIPSGFVARKRKVDKSILTRNFVGEKDSLAVWFVSNCKTKSLRRLLTTQMQKHIHIDIFGECGKKKCPRTKQKRCYKRISKKYFFYLAFENSLCDDYITEKLFNVLQLNIIPVVYGSGPYWKHAPPHSYIDVFDFNSVKDLTDYMIHLSKTPEEYNSYFRWKAYYTVILSNNVYHSLCKMCELLNTDQRKSISSSRYDIDDWYRRKSHCISASSSPVKEFLNGTYLQSAINTQRKVNGWFQQYHH